MTPPALMDERRADALPTYSVDPYVRVRRRAMLVRDLRTIRRRAARRARVRTILRETAHVAAIMAGMALAGAAYLWVAL